MISTDISRPSLHESLLFIGLYSSTSTSPSSSIGNAGSSNHASVTLASQPASNQPKSAKQGVDLDLVMSGAKVNGSARLLVDRE